MNIDKIKMELEQMRGHSNQIQAWMMEDLVRGYDPHQRKQVMGIIKMLIYNDYELRNIVSKSFNQGILEKTL